MKNKLACEKHNRILIGKKKCVDCFPPQSQSEEWKYQLWRQIFGRHSTLWNYSKQETLKKTEEFISNLLKQQKEDLKQRKSCSDCGDIYTCSCYNPSSPKYKFYKK